MAQLERAGRAGMGVHGACFLESLKILPQPRYHVLQPFNIIPPCFSLVNDRPILDISRPVRILEGVDRLGSVPLG